MDWLQIAASAVSGGATAYFAFRWIGERWLQAQFDQKLESVRHKLNETLDRKIKLHTGEFEALPAIWQTLIKADIAVLWFSQIDSLEVDLNKLRYNELREFASRTKLDENALDELNLAQDKSAYYYNYLRKKNFDKALEAINEADNCFSKFSIYCTWPMSAAIKGFIDAMFKQIMHHNQYLMKGWDYKDARALAISRAYQENRGVRRVALEKMIKDRLWSEPEEINASATRLNEVE